MERKDIHRPSAINPLDYVFVAFEYVGPYAFEFLMVQREKIREHMKTTGGTYSNHEHGGNCHVCGAHCIYTVLFYHAKTNTYIRTGQDCAAKMDMAFSNDGMDVFKSRVKQGLEAVAGKRKAETKLQELGLSKAWSIYQDTTLQGVGQEGIVKDIVGRLVTYGSLSEKQVQFLHKLLDQIEQRPARLAVQQAERAAAEDCPTGRVKVQGEVVKTSAVETQFGVTQKMVVKADQGFLVYVTIPSGLSVDRGVRVAFVATITPSSTDSKFGFGKRPVAVSA